MANVLFLCTGNSCRSQIAEGWLRHLAADRYTAYSAGLDPTALNPLAVEAMREVGIDISAQQSKNVTSFLGQHFPHIITVCDRAQASCPIFPGVCFRQHWPIDDPATATGTHEERMQIFRITRDEIGRRVRAFIADPMAPPEPHSETVAV